MKAYRFWRVHEAVCGRPDEVPYKLRAWGGSNRDEADAESAAEMRLSWMKERILFTKVAPKPAAEYEYGSGVIREEWLQLLAGSEDEPAAVITRNRYGAPVLNARELAIIDIDLPPPPGRGLAFWKKPPDLEALATAKIRDWQKRNAQVSLRVYRTPNGFRLLRTDAPLAPDSAEAEAMLRELGNDPLYAALCKRQQCFRARLGPKPFRAQLPLPPGSFPRAGMKEAEFAIWLVQYELASTQFAACRYLESLGGDAIAPSLHRLVTVHDEFSGALSQRPLA